MTPDDSQQSETKIPTPAPLARPKPLGWAQLPLRVGLARIARLRANQVIRREVPSASRQAFRIDLAAMFLAGVYTGAIFPFVNVIARDDLRGSKEILALITASPFLGNLLALFWAQAVEGRKKLPFVKAMHLTARSCILLSAVATGAWPFAMVISTAQIIGTIPTPAYAAVIKEVYPDDQRGRLLGYTRGCIVVGQVLGTLAAGWLMAFVSYRWVFPFAGVAGMVSALIFARIRREEEPPQEARAGGSPLRMARETGRFVWSTLGILKEDQAYRWFALSVFTYGFGNLMTVPLVPVIQVNQLHIRKEELAMMSNAMQIVAVVGYFYWGRYVDRRSPQRAVVVNILINTVVPLNYILTGAFPGSSAWTLLPAFIMSGVVMAGIDLSYFNALLTFAGPADVSRYQALQSFLLGIRGSIAPFLGTSLAYVLEQHRQNLRWVFGLGLAMMLAGAWMQVMAMRRQEALFAVRSAGQELDK